MRIPFAIVWMAAAVPAADLVVEVEPRWEHWPLELSELTLKNAAGQRLSVTRFACLLSDARLQGEDGKWVSAGDWYAFLDLEKKRTSFTLAGVPAAKYRALRFDLGLDAAADGSDPAKREAGHPLHPDVNGLHRGSHGGYVFLAIEGRWQHADEKGKEGGYSWHLAGEPCRRTIEVPAELDLRSNLRVTLVMDAAQICNAGDPTAIAGGDVAPSGTDGDMENRMADNAVTAFCLRRVEPLAPSPESAPTVTVTSPGGVSLEIPARFPPAAWPADNALTKDGIALGRRLFNDGRLSENYTVSCATCHWEQLAFSDSPRFSIGTNGEPGTRNAMPLMNLAWKSSYFWDGRVSSLREQVMHPIRDPLEMNEKIENVIAKLQRDRFYARQFAKTFGSPGVTAERLGLALEQYLLTLVSGDSKFDRALRGRATLTEEEKLGFELFFTDHDPGRGILGAGCFHCHGGAHFTNDAFMNNGLDSDASLADPGRGKVTGNPADRGKFMVPSLRNLTLTDPYMHDGRFETLEAVIEHYDHGVVPSATLDPRLARHLPHGGLGLTPGEKQALVAFLETLTDEPEE